MPPKPTTSQIAAMAEQFKEDLLNLERQSASRLVRHYGAAYKRMQSRIRALTNQIERARITGTRISPAWLFQIERYQELMRQVESETSRFAGIVESTIKTNQRNAGLSGIANAQAIGTASIQAADLTVSFSTLNPSAVESMVGYLADGSPLTRILSRLPRMAAQSVTDALIEGVTLGYNPEKTARLVRNALGGDLNRALTITRTETLRAYREATYQTNLKNSSIGSSWVWIASYSRRTCASCLALAGSVHPLSERMESHPRCRCTQMFLVNGLPNRVEPGNEWFAKQDEPTQRAIIGTNAGYEAYQQGNLKLTDLVGRKNDPQWGNQYHQLSVRKALQQQGQFPGYNRQQQDAVGDLLTRLGGMPEQ